MNLFGPLSRALALGGVLICAGALPVMAAPADIALLKTYLGTIGEELDFFGLDKFETKYRFRLELDANWKMVVDAFNAK